MKVSYKWLKEYLDLSDVTPAELAEKMSRTGIEVDDVIYPGKGLSKIVVGETLSVVDHPDSDHLHVCQVNIGAGTDSDRLRGAECGWRPKSHRGFAWRTHHRQRKNQKGQDAWPRIERNDLFVG